MTIIEELKIRSENPSDSVKIELKLYNLADKLEKKARNHLKRITNVLPEFDIHDEKHSEKVVYNIEKLLASNVPKLSSYELFLIQLSCFFHDCAMAPSDWELNVLKFTEGSTKFKMNDKSVGHDLKEPFKISYAKQIIKENKTTFYGTFNDEIKGWLFSPKNENELIDYLATMLIEYQNYRNGFAELIRKINSKEDFESLTNFIRTDYIRATHHLRIQTYVNNLESIFGNSFEQPAWGKRLAKDLALICRSHGEDISFLENFNMSAQYYGNESANLQLVGMLLRLGDIIHFSFDRAPLELRTSKIFKSEFSFLQWALKNNGANYSIENGKISFRAYCETPEIYFKLHNYLDWIEIEIQNYFKLDRLWSKPYKSYIPNLQDKIERTNITNDENVFLPKRGLSFSLNQKRIIELLMGVGLYKDKFACLRELYQNALDACRCMISEAKSIQNKAIGRIQFSIERNGDKVYLCCKDNGIGMSKEIIEKHLLKIGNSYYKSTSFYKKQAQWGGAFTPTSQFGIGILSCFMLGNKIEIITKTKKGDFVSCAIDGPHENFYYKTTTDIEKELISESGTVIKILLSDENKNISNRELDKLFLLLEGKPNYFPEQFEEYEKLYKDWDNHLYRLVNSFITLIPDNIYVSIILENESDLQILNKPILPTDIKFLFTKEDLEFLDFLNSQGRFVKLNVNYSDVKDSLETYEIDIKSESIQFRTTLTLPKPGAIDPELHAFYSVPKIGSSAVCVDGLSINDHHISISNFYSDSLHRSGILNFIGENTPQLTVDRTSLVNYPSEYEKIAEEISKTLIQEVISRTREHISKYKLKTQELELLWKFVFDKIGFADTIFINELSYTDYGNIQWNGIVNVTGKNLTIKDFLKSEKLEFKDFNYPSLDKLTEKLILFKLISAEKIDVTKDSVIYQGDKLYKATFLGKKNDLDFKKILLKSDNWDKKYFDFDIVSSLFPLIPKHLFNALETCEATKINDRTKIVHTYENGITAFFDQDPLLINETLGLYTADSRPFEKNVNRVYQFDKKRATFHLMEINNRFGDRSGKEQIVLTVFVAPRKLNEDEKEKLEVIKTKDSSYYNGVINGWSILITGKQKHNMIILSGARTRAELSSALPNEFWEENKDIKFKYLNGKGMKNHS
ncbi:Histidine kinase-, DNA gyrase B-, and HSP90-like ATPase [Tenacibaculum sp. MAR_2009_124]|uniref:HD domain-containing protein n=1 Tax=Tenacibaculum sp. MAR_2009_124 TaxID=1250059 RepID=UPI0008950DAE|nr:ATP-binding protein [Tenacibaculum sp. MAR_2009_124]SED23268.1 Histidine kinase-, DNA gyrase B-, and HSP90-like ATPase [Tenacibaculum sp. MAR_2009_124]